MFLKLNKNGSGYFAINSTLLLEVILSKLFVSGQS